MTHPCDARIGGNYTQAPCPNEGTNEERTPVGTRFYCDAHSLVAHKAVQR